MKKGCFLVAISILTVIIAAVIYVFRFHEDDIIKMVKPLVLGESEEELYEKIDHLKVRDNTDSLKKVVVSFVKNLETSHKIDLEHVEDFFKKANQMVDDGRVDSVELSSLSYFLKNQN